jgi:hypothetical protein
VKRAQWRTLHNGILGDLRRRERLFGQQTIKRIER